MYDITVSGPERERLLLKEAISADRLHRRRMWKIIRELPA